ncbi:MAG: nucleotidyltransferase domain-containing protein [Leptospiraceae bacterium]|nr:nucleotidyltransferase domain-containing protein [Leptospiraceae bacterium]
MAGDTKIINREKNNIKDIEKLPSLTKKLENDPVIKTFKEKIVSELKDNFQFAILFGSQAREESNEKSDYDFLIIVNEKDRKLEEKIENIGVYFLDTYFTLISCLIWRKEDWEFNKFFPIGRNILREGRLL